MKGFFDAVKKGSIPEVKAQKEKLGVDLKFILDEQYKQNAQFYAVTVKDIDQGLAMVKYLWEEEGVDYSLLDGLGQSCLFYAARDGKAPIVDYLLTQGIDADVIDTYEQTCMFYAAREGHTEVCKLLIEKGEVDADRVDHNG